MGDTKKSGDDFLGERMGDWVITAKAPAENRKRMWRVTNTQNDETRVVAQTDLKKLETDVPLSADITARVLLANYADNPFGIPDGVLPDDDDEYPFDVSFVAPAGAWVPMEDHRGFVFDPAAANPFEMDGQMSIDDIEDEPENIDPNWDEDIPGAEEFVADWVVPREPADPLRSAVLDALRQLDGLRDTLDAILKATLSR